MFFLFQYHFRVVVVVAGADAGDAGYVAADVAVVVVVVVAVVVVAAFFVYIFEAFDVVQWLYVLFVFAQA